MVTGLSLLCILLAFLCLRVYRQILSSLVHHSFQLVTTINKRDETETLLLKTCLILLLTFLLLTDFKTLHGKIGGFMSLFPHAKTLRLHAPCLKCKHWKDCLSLRAFAEIILVT